MNARIVAATNRNLEQAVKEKLFRQDLFYRLNVITITLPPLRERRDDVLLFAAHFIEGYNQVLQRTVRRITPSAQKILQTYSWPGNIRELRNAIQHAMIVSEGDELASEHFPTALLHIKEEQQEALPSWQGLLNCHQLSLNEARSVVEQYYVRKALQADGSNKKRIAKALGFSSVDQLRYFMRKHGIESCAQK